MTINFRTRVELTCWDIIIPMMSRLRDIRTNSKPKHANPITYKQFMTQVLVWSTVGLFIGVGISYIWVSIR